jgi:hypothetical protein
MVYTKEGVFVIRMLTIEWLNFALVKHLDSSVLHNLNS